MSADNAVIYEFRQLRKVFTFIATSKVAMVVKTLSQLSELIDHGKLVTKGFQCMNMLRLCVLVVCVCVTIKQLTGSRKSPLDVNINVYKMAAPHLAVQA